MSRSDWKGLDASYHQYCYDLLLFSTLGTNAYPESPFHISDPGGKTVLERVLITVLFTDWITYMAVRGESQICPLRFNHVRRAFRQTDVLSGNPPDGDGGWVHQHTPKGFCHSRKLQQISRRHVAKDLRIILLV